MSTRSEIDKLIAAARGALTAEAVVEAAKNAAKFPELHKHLWQVPEDELAQEARVQRAHKLLIRIRIVSEAGTTTRLLMHTPGVRGYQPTSTIVSIPDLANLKLQQLQADISRARERLRAFRSFIPDAISDEIDTALERAETAAKQTKTERASA